MSDLSLCLRFAGKGRETRVLWDPRQVSEKRVKAEGGE